MDVTYERCCGIDVHKRSIVACLRCGKKQEIRTFDTTSKEIRALAKWLWDEKCQMAAMESTGSYWKPVYNLFETSHLGVMIVNARNMKNVPGRKTDVKDAEWIADLLQHGLLSASYIPKREQRELREVSRYRKSLIAERARELNRLQKMLEGGNVELSSVVANSNGKSSRSLLQKLLKKDAPLQKDEVEESLHGALRHKVEDVMQALDGFLTPLQKQLILQVVDHIDDMTKRIGQMDKLVKQYSSGYEDAIEKLDEIPGIGRQSAETILAETGLDMSRFATEKHSFLSAQYDRLVVRRGAKRATVAVAHTMLIAIYHILKLGEPFIDLGADYYNKFNKERKINSYLTKLKKLGWQPETATFSAAST